MEKIPELNKSEALLSRLEGLEWLTTQDLMHLVLVLEGAKNVTDIELDCPFIDAYENEQHYFKDKEDYERTIQILGQALNDFGLMWTFERQKVEEDENNSPGYQRIVFLISKDRIFLEELEDASNHMEDNKRMRNFGEIFQIPETAVEAWTTGAEILDDRSYPKEIEDSEYKNFINFAFSKDHWREEFEVVKQRAEFIKEHAPSLYKKIVEEGQAEDRDE